MIKKCYAKLNLSLDSLYKRYDGYHEIDSLMVKISLFDKLEIKRNFDKKIRIFSDNKKLTKIEDNLIYKAWDVLKDQIIDNGIDVFLEKNIPMAAGLAGGSTDCAETLKILNEIWGLNYSKEKLKKLAVKLGADVSFFLEKGSQRARGIGEILNPFYIKNPIKFLLINDGTEISSKYIYDRLSDYGVIPTDLLIKYLENGDNVAYDYFLNVMEDVAFKKFPHLKEIRDKIKILGGLKSMMSGSGATIFGVFDDDEKLQKAYEKVKDKYKFVEKVSIVND